MQVLVLNGGSSSIKFKLYNKGEDVEIMGGLLEKIESPKSILTVEKGDNKVVSEVEVEDVSHGFEKVFELFTEEENKVLYDVDEISAIGHRMVHGVNYKSSMLVDDEVYTTLKNNLHLAPLHNPSALSGVEMAQKHFKGIPNVLVFDTSYHQTMPEYAYMYPVSLDYYNKHQLRRYGAHGTSHHFISQALAKHLNKDYDKFNCITAHLGNGCSLTAIKDGKSIDTSMGLTPLEGVMMGTRSGSIDPAIIGFICDRENKGVGDVITELNKKSGLLAIAGVNDMRDVEEKIAQGDKYAKLAFDMFTTRIKKQIGAYIALLDGKLDALIFSGGIGENDVQGRMDITSGLEYCGIELDTEKNSQRKKGIRDIGKKVYIVPTNEELQICRDTIEISKI